MAHLAHRTQGKRNPQANVVSQDTSSNSRCSETIQEIGSSSEGSHVPQQDESLYRSLPYIVLSGAKWIPPFIYLCSLTVFSIFLIAHCYGIEVLYTC